VTTGTARASVFQSHTITKKKSKKYKKKQAVPTTVTVDPTLGNGGDEGIPEEIPEVETDPAGRSSVLAPSVSDTTNSN